jgi:hypothetical protein
MWIRVRPVHTAPGHEGATQAAPQHTGSEPQVPAAAQPLSSLTGAGGQGAKGLGRSLGCEGAGGQGEGK